MGQKCIKKEINEIIFKPFSSYYLQIILFILFVLFFLVPDHSVYAGLGFDDPVPMSNKGAGDGTMTDRCADIATDGTKWIATWQGQNPSSTTDYDIYVAVSTDGTTWSYSKPINSSSYQGCPSIATDGQGNWVIVFSSAYNSTDIYGQRHVFSLRSSNGINWYLSVVKAGTSATSAYGPEVASDGKGNWIVVWYSNNRYTSSNDTLTDYDLFASFSTDNGASWSNPGPVNTDASSDGLYDDDSNPSVASTGPANDWLVAWEHDWQTSTTGGGEIMWSRYSRGTWSNPDAVPETTHRSHYPTIVTDERTGPVWCIAGQTCPRYVGDFAISWKQSGTYEYVYTKKRNTICTPKSCSSSWESRKMFTAGARDQTIYAPTMHSAGEVFVLMYQRADGKIGVQYSENSGGTWSSGTFPNDQYPFDTLSSPSLAADDSGRWKAVWSSNTDWGGTTGTDSDIFVASLVPPVVTSVNRYDNHNPTDEDYVSFLVDFSEQIRDVDNSYPYDIDFQLTTTGTISSADIDWVGVTSDPSIYQVNVQTGSGTGTIRLDVKDGDTIKDMKGNPLGGIGSGNGNFTSGQSYTISAPPEVVSINRHEPSGEATLASQVKFRVTFSESVKGVNAADFNPSGSLTVKNITAVSASSGSIIDVTVNTGTTESGTLRLDLIDNNSIRAVDDNHPLYGWGYSDYTSGQEYVVDRTPPDSNQAYVNSKTGPYTISTDKFIFEWGGFTEDNELINPIESYEVALTDTDDEPLETDYKNVGKTIPYTFTKQEWNSGNPFNEMKYWCWVRAVNKLGKKSSPAPGAVTVDTKAVKFGGDILEFETAILGRSLQWTDINWPETDKTLPLLSCTSGSCTGKLIKVEMGQTKTLISGDMGPFTVDWYFAFDYNEDGKIDTADYLKKTYNTSSETEKEAMIIYHTNDGQDNEGNIVPGSSPTVSLSRVPFVKIHHNSVFPFISPDDPQHFQKSFLWTDGTTLRARSNTGLIVLQYSTATELIGFEIVEVKLDQPEEPVLSVDVGSRLAPYREVPDAVTPFVRMGNTSPKYIYQHLIQNQSGFPQEGLIWALRPNSDSNNMQVIWKRTGLYGVEWPYEMRRYRSAWPTDPAKYQLYVRGHESDLCSDEVGQQQTCLGPKVSIHSDLSPELIYYQMLKPDGSVNPQHHAILDADLTFNTNGANGWALLKYATGPTAGLEWVGFEVVRAILHDNADVLNINENIQDIDIGSEITDDYHEGSLPGYIHSPEGDKYAHTTPKGEAIYDMDVSDGFTSRSGQIFAVNKGKLEVWWSNLSRKEDPQGTEWPAWPGAKADGSEDHLRVQWPSKVVRYDAVWPSAPEKIIIARQDGSGVINEEIYGSDWEIYYQNDSSKPGFNPNDEHALDKPSADGTGMGIFALRDDLGSEDTSDPYALMIYKDQDALPDSVQYKFRVFNVVAEEDPYYFHEWEGFVRPDDKYEGEAGLIIQAPYPINILSCPQEDPANPGTQAVCSKGVSGSYWLDRKGALWAKAAGKDGGPSDIVAHFYYPMKISDKGFFLPGDDQPLENELVPFLDRGTGIPVDVMYKVSWPAVDPMQIGMTVIDSAFGLPAIDPQCSVDVIYQQSLANGGGPSVSLIDPVQTRSVPLTELPTDIETEDDGINKVFIKLSVALRKRVRYDTQNGLLNFFGVGKKEDGDIVYPLIDPITGYPYVLLNVMSDRDLQELLNLSADPRWETAVDSLHAISIDPIILEDSNVPHDMKALTSGLAQGTGYVTLAMANADACGTLPISLYVIEVVPTVYRGGIDVHLPDCAFDEAVTLRHTGDFGGLTDNFEFDWRIEADNGGNPPATSYDNWETFPMVPADGSGAIDITIAGANLITLRDNWAVTRFCSKGLDCDDSANWSDWTEPQFAMGWIKRIMDAIDPFEQRIKDFDQYQVNTMVSMISQAGPRWVGDVAMNCTPESLNSKGLIEIYETVLNRGADLSIDGTSPVSYPPANQALLFAAGRIADLYMLLGNEAYADAADPTIAFGTNDNQEATSIHAFMNQTSTLLEEEIDLLRGRDDSNSSVKIHPHYNRLLWNFTNDITGGEVAYALNYNIRDALGNVDGEISEDDARIHYPQGHGDAWGHYLTAIKAYYRLLRHPVYTWLSRAEGYSLGGIPVQVDYYDERKFTAAAAAKARTGAEIVNLIYREKYVEDPSGQWQGYRDSDPDRAWGFSEWASRAGAGTYFDWVVGNAILPATSDKTGIEKIDRTTVLELKEVSSRFQEIQAQLDTGDLGVNPLGLATNVVPFDISPSEIDQGKTHFEQIYEKAVTAMNNAITVFNHANNSTQLLRRQADTEADFKQNVNEREIDFNNRLIEMFGYPYPDDIGPGKTYPTGYDGYDKYHYAYVDPSALMGVDPPPVVELPLTFSEITVQDDGSLQTSRKEVKFHISSSGDRFGLVKPEEWTSERRAPGEIQMARTDLLLATARYEKALVEYDHLLTSIEDQAELLRAQYGLNDKEINILNAQFNEQKSLNKMILNSRKLMFALRSGSRAAKFMATAIAEGLPTAVGFSNDVAAPGRAAIRIAGAIMGEMAEVGSDLEAIRTLGHQNAQQEMQAQSNITLTTERQEFGILQQLRQLEQTIRQEISLRLELYGLQESISQASGRYLTTLTRGQRLKEDLSRFRRQTAADVQVRRYKDMAFRIFRNDALQKYRAQFDLAARYVYLTAKAYDFETTLLSNDWMAGESFLTDIVRARLIGTISGGLPQTGMGLADSMAKMSQNFVIYKSQIGFYNPQKETNRFSIRSEFFRIQPGPEGDTLWRDTLRRNVVDNLLDLPEFERYARIFSPHLAKEPGIVIPFETFVNFGENFFGWPAGGGDNSYDSTNFATKVRSVGVWFTNYNNLMGSGMINTPRVYMIPVGSDILRSPTGLSGEIRTFQILDQKLPAPFKITSNALVNEDWIPRIDTLTGTFAEVRKYSSFRAYHDSEQFNPAETIRDSRLIGRSVWNTKWLLVIPAGTLHGDRTEGLNRFIDGMLRGNERDGNGVMDIKIFFETYAYSGN